MIFEIGGSDNGIALRMNSNALNAGITEWLLAYNYFSE